MPKVCKKTFGKMVSCINRETGETYESGRASYLDKPGLIIIKESLNECPGSCFVSIYPPSVGGKQPYLHTGFGDALIFDDGCELVTEHSEYYFRFGDFGLKDNEKTELLLNCD